MHIELTDHLRCPADHPEQFMVLLPSRMEGRRVVSGELGCPVCGAVITLDQGVADWGARPRPGAPTALTAQAVTAFLGLGGPGGYVALAGAPASLAEDLLPLLPGVRLVLVNPDPGALDSESASVLFAPRFPLKTGSMRGVVLGAPLSAEPGWIGGAVEAVLPGLRMVVEGGEPPSDGIELLASGPGVWVGKRRSAGRPAT